MYYNIKGKISEVSPTYIVIEANDIGYFINISLGTYTKVKDLKEVNLYLHHSFKIEATTPVGIVFFGFFEKKERKLFRHLISVSRVGNRTAMLMLSSLSPQEIYSAIINNQADVLISVKGIGTKAAQRIIIELKDKLAKEEFHSENIEVSYNTDKIEALSALNMLGFNKNVASKALDRVLKLENSKDFPVEELIKRALKIL